MPDHDLSMQRGAVSGSPLGLRFCPFNFGYRGRFQKFCHQALSRPPLTPLCPGNPRYGSQRPGGASEGLRGAYRTCYRLFGAQGLVAKTFESDLRRVASGCFNYIFCRCLEPHPPTKLCTTGVHNPRAQVPVRENILADLQRASSDREYFRSSLSTLELRSLIPTKRYEEHAWCWNLAIRLAFLRMMRAGSAYRAHFSQGSRRCVKLARGRHGRCVARSAIASWK
jgi:hypothetical protein